MPSVASDLDGQYFAMDALRKTTFALQGRDWAEPTARLLGKPRHEPTTSRNELNIDLIKSIIPMNIFIPIHVKVAPHQRAKFVTRLAFCVLACLVLGGLPQQAQASEWFGSTKEQ